MRTDPHIPEIEQIEERKEKLRKDWLLASSQFIEVLEKGLFYKPNEIADWWLDRLDSYAQFKIDQLFNEENNRKGGRGLLDKETI